MAKCAFCGDEIEKGTGKLKIMKDGRLVPLCSMKCEKNMFSLRRVPREIQWTKEYKDAKAVRLGGEKKAAKKK